MSAASGAQPGAACLLGSLPLAGGAPGEGVPRHVAVVGNAPGLRPAAAAIDAADWVVRFNNAAGFGASAGRRVTHIVLVNFGGQMGEWLGEPGFVDRPVVRAARRFLLPVHPGGAALAAPAPLAAKRAAPGEHDWTPEAVEILGSLARPVSLLPGEWEEDCARLLACEGGRTAGDPPVPSTGFLLVRRLVETVGGEGARIECHGFGFAGWEGHDWPAERRWFERMAGEGRLVLHPVGEG